MIPRAAISAIGLAVRAAQQWIAGGTTEAAHDGIVVSAIALAATLALLDYKRHVITHPSSLAIATYHAH